jgi:hypothetical protein
VRKHARVVSYLWSLEGDDGALFSASAISIDEVSEVDVKLLIDFDFENGDVEEGVLGVLDV